MSSRRRFIKAAASVLAGTPLAWRAARAGAGDKTLVFVNWGGDALRSYDQAYGQAFLRQTGVTDGSDASSVRLPVRIRSTTGPSFFAMEKR